MTKKNRPNVLNLLIGVFLINSNIFLILDGKMARNKPSTKKSNPIAVIRSFIEIILSWFHCFAEKFKKFTVR
jgi:hypothetical protein